MWTGVTKVYVIHVGPGPFMSLNDVNTVRVGDMACHPTELTVVNRQFLKGK